MNATVVSGGTGWPHRQVPAGWRLVVLVGGLAVFGSLCIDMYLPAFPSINRELHADASQVQLTLTSCLVGIGLGQLLLGPISDRVGRRPPLLAGLSAFFVSSIACAFASDIYALAALRFIEGLGGAAGIVISRSVVRDLYSGVALVRFFSTLMLMTGLGPILAPQIGSWTLAFTTWRGIFVVLGGLGLILLVTAWWRVPETLAPNRRQRGSAWSTMHVMRDICRDRVFVGYIAACGLGQGATFAYVAGSPFVLQHIYGLTPEIYGTVFALSAGGMIVGAQVNGRCAARTGSSALLNCGLLTMVAAAAVLLTVVARGAPGLVVVIPAMVVFMFGWGFVGPSAMGLGLHRYPQSAGAASAVLGTVQFLTAAAIAPLAGLGGTADALPMALLMLMLPIAALGIRVLTARVALVPP
jgi:DHA1 family bicyclomycin/chloramphenicol resistance-like MFS transporter